MRHDRFLDTREYRRYLAFRTRHGYKPIHDAFKLKTFERFLAERQIESLSAIGPSFVMEYAVELLKSRKPQTVNAHLGILDNFFKYLERMDLCEFNLLSDRVGFRGLQFCPYVFSDAEVDRILHSFATDVAQRKHLRDFVFHLELSMHRHDYCSLWITNIRGMSSTCERHQF